MKLSLNPLPAAARESACPGPSTSTVSALAGAATRISLRLAWAIAMAVLLLLSAACHPANSKQSAAMPPVPVFVAQAEQRDVPIVVNAVGTIAPFSMVQIKTMVSAEITKAFFKEGDFVKKGQLLFQLDPRSFDADLLKARGQLARDKATAVTARSNAARYAALFKEGVIAREQYENMMSAADQAEAAVLADEGAVESARVNVTFTKIYSPINGRTGNLQLYPGNVSKANDLPLVTINEVSPIYASFAIPEQFLPEVKRQIAKGSLQVQATIPSTTVPADIGKVTFIDNTVDRTTGTITLKATFPNQGQQAVARAVRDRGADLEQSSECHDCSVAGGAERTAGSIPVCRQGRQDGRDAAGQARPAVSRTAHRRTRRSSRRDGSHRRPHPAGAGFQGGHQAG